MKSFLALFIASIVSPLVEGRDIPRDAVCLKQSDFDSGTKIITAPGNYKLCEDIMFNPNNAPKAGEPPGEDACDPIFPDYDENAYGLGFFSAIAIAASDVNIYLNGHTIEQSAEHALMQRFFAVIELADSPFIKDAGPAQFVGKGRKLRSASRIGIIGPGTIGRSSHHGIHGNDNRKVKIRDVTFRDFEVAAISLNNVDGLHIRSCHIPQNRHDVPVVGLFSAARNIRPYGKALKEKGYTMNIRGVLTSAADVYDKLIDSINKVYSDVILGSGIIDKAAHPEEYELFHNPHGVIDGPCYAFLVHGKGPAVGGQGEKFNANNETTTSSNIVIRDNTIENIKCWTNEVPAAAGDVNGPHGAVANDARGAVLQLVSTYNSENPQLAINADGTYKGNVVADMQIMVAKAIEDGVLSDTPLHQTGTNTINPVQTAWAMSGSTTYEPKYRCNGDSMHHVNKGIVAIRVEDTKGFIIKRNTIRSIVNLSPAPFSECFDYHEGASTENPQEQQGGNIRAISVAAVRGFRKKKKSKRGKKGKRRGKGKSRRKGKRRKRTVRSLVEENIILGANSEHANVIIGIDVQGDSKAIAIEHNEVDLQDGVGKQTDDKYIALRVRKFARGSGRNSILIRKNDLKQEKRILNANRRRLSGTHEELHGHMSGDIEWRTGGCPFARGAGMGHEL